MAKQKSRWDIQFHRRKGKLLGRGSTRDVYVDKLDPSRVIKISRRLPAFANWREALISHAVKGTKYANLFAEVFEVSRSGKYLVMERLSPLIGNEAVPAFPSWFTDRKIKNLGKSGGVIRAIDYAQSNIESLLESSHPIAWHSLQSQNEMGEILRALNEIESRPE